MWKQKHRSLLEHMMWTDRHLTCFKMKGEHEASDHPHIIHTSSKLNHNLISSWRNQTLSHHLNHLTSIASLRFQTQFTQPKELNPNDLPSDHCKCCKCAIITYQKIFPKVIKHFDFIFRCETENLCSQVKHLVVLSGFQAFLWIISMCFSPHNPFYTKGKSQICRMRTTQQLINRLYIFLTLVGRSQMFYYSEIKKSLEINSLTRSTQSNSTFGWTKTSLK